jgi:hypothetical protein
VTRSFIFAREQLRSPFALVLLVAVPAVFVLAAARVLAEFSVALGGDLAGTAATALSGGWAAAFIAGMLGFFEASAARGPDRRLAVAGAGALQVASSRILACLGLVLLAALSSFVAVSAGAGLAHPWHAVAGITGFAVTYLGIGVAVGAVLPARLEGSLAVTFVFLLDAFSGPGMARQTAWTSVSRWPAEVLIDAGMGRASPPGHLALLALTSALALSVAALAFSVTGRGRR